MKNPALLSSPRAELHVVQRAAPPAREPGPVAVDAVGRAVMPAGVEQPVMMMSVATTGFSAFGFSALGSGVFYAGAAFFFRTYPSFRQP